MKRLLLLIFVSLAAIGLLLWLILPSGTPEPVYQGKSLRHWLAFLNSTQQGNVDDLNRTFEAVRQIGTNAIPTLLEMLQEKDSPLKLKWIALLDKQHFIPPPAPAQWHNFQATIAFSTLGPTASNAVPALVKIYHMKISQDSQLAALESISFIGPSVLIRLSKNDPDPSVRANAAYILKRMAPSLPPPAASNK